MLNIIGAWSHRDEEGRSALRDYEWHVGEGIPEITGRVITFQADGDELECIVNALKATSKPKSVDELIEIPGGLISPQVGWQMVDGKIEALNDSLDSYKKMIGRRIEFLEERMNSIERIFNMEFLEEKE
tara:strand:+ start:283 stop:669 length:387 start_codon:yes stop_codon:yes gene_type:complete